MSDKEVLNLTEIKKNLEEFAKERDWEQFHTPKNLSMALAVEASELMEILQWKETGALSELSKESETYQKIREEIADIVVYAIRFSTVLDIDIPQAIEEKMMQNAKKYPASLVKGSSKKYTEY